jgi:hypothetical protein
MERVDRKGSVIIPSSENKPKVVGFNPKPGRVIL